MLRSNECPKDEGKLLCEGPMDEGNFVARVFGDFGWHIRIDSPLPLSVYMILFNRFCGGEPVAAVFVARDFTLTNE